MKRAVTCLLFVALLAGCRYSSSTGGDKIVGSGERKTERRDVAEFDSVTVEGAYRVEVTCGGGQSRGLEVEADDNLLPLIKTEVEGGRLRISAGHGWKTEALPRVRISVPDLREVSVPGASDFRVDGLNNDALKVNVEGASKFRASGETVRLDILLNGAGLVDARELRARSASVVTNGAGTVTVHATHALDATVNGVGTIDYYGNPANVNPKVNGIGKITRK